MTTLFHFLAQHDPFQLFTLLNPFCAAMQLSMAIRT